MNLVKIGNIYINADRVDALSGSYLFGNATTATNIYVGGSKQPFIIKKNIDEVAAILETGKEDKHGKDSN